MRIVIDRIEGAFAIVEIAGRAIEVPLALLPDGAREGATLRLVLEDPASEANILKEAAERLKRLALHGPKSDDIEL